ncbi:MAG: phosphate ABC transporter substrate-binding protein [Pirellulales bacterium]
MKPFARSSCLLLPMALAVAVVTATIAGCFSDSRRDDSTIRITGSDTMVNLAQAWAEAYHEAHPDISSPVRGGGSGVGIAALINGKVDVATASRAMKDKEIALARQNTGKEPKQFIVGRDALAIYVHKDNPLDEITIDALAEIYGEDGTITTWPQLGVDNADCAGGEIIRISRQNNSGTYAYFREIVLGEKREYKQGATAQSGSSELVTLISRTPCAIGYSGMGYYRPGEVKMLRVSRKKGEPAIEPTLETALDNTYPISRPLYIYTLGEPTGAVQEFVEWILGPEGQKIVADVGYVPNPKATETPSAGGDSGDNRSADKGPVAAGADPAANDASPRAAGQP